MIYTASSSHHVKACVSHCPCYDVPKLFSVHPDFTRTFISAVASYDIPFEDGLKEISPIHRVSDMPSIPYLIIADEEDELFDVDGIEEYVKQLQGTVDSTVLFRRLPNLTHGQFTPEVYREMIHFIITNSKD